MVHVDASALERERPVGNRLGARGKNRVEDDVVLGIEALLGRRSAFKRTPKLRVEKRGDDWRRRRYRGSTNLVPFLELGFALYFTAGAYYAASNSVFGPLPFILLFSSGFFYAAAMSLLQPAFDARSQQA